MKLGLGISLALHAAGLILLSDLGADDGGARPPDDVVTLDVDILTEAEFVAITSPVPISHTIVRDPMDSLQQVEIDVTALAITPPEIRERIQQLPANTLEIPARPEIPAVVPPAMDRLPVVTELAPVPDETEEFTFGVETGVPDEARLTAALDLTLADTLQLPEAPRVDRTITPESRPELVRDDESREVTRADLAVDAEPVEASDVASAPEESTLKIVTEAERADEAATPAVSHSENLSALLGQGVPLQRPPEPIFEGHDIIEVITGDLIDQQIASLAAVPPPVTPSVQLTREEIGSIRRAIEDEWNIGPLSSEAQHVIVTVRIRFDEEGQVVRLDLIDSSGGGNEAVQKAYDVAKRAINKAFENGVGLPATKYEEWKVLEMTFDPETMRRL